MAIPAPNFVPMAQLQPPPPPPPNDYGIKDVWNHNLHDEFHIIRQIVQKYHWVAMDTEFPGVVARPLGEFRSTADYQYQLLRCNVDLLRIIQLGLTFMDENGKTPPGYTTWQFNFKFNLQEDMYAQDSIDLLQNSGLQFRKHEEDGIDPLEFAELIMSSGLVLMDNIKWLSFHSGYDFGYLLKLLTDQNLPMDENEFFETLHMFFPTIYDVKYLMKLCKNLKGGLQEVADQLELRRVGPQHQAGSDSHLTGMAFFKIKEIFFDGNIESSSGHLYGLGPHSQQMPITSLIMVKLATPPDPRRAAVPSRQHRAASSLQSKLLLRQTPGAGVGSDCNTQFQRLKLSSYSFSKRVMKL